MSVVEETKAKRKRNPRKSAARPPCFLTTGQVARRIGVCPRLAGHVLDRHPDLAYRINEDRRIVAPNLEILLLREGITNKHLGIINAKGLFWVGSPVAQFRRSRDMTGTPMEAVAVVLDFKCDAVACLMHGGMLTGDIIGLAKICEDRGVRFAAVLPDDATDLKRTPMKWMFRMDDPVSLTNVVDWLRGEDDG